MGNGAEAEVDSFQRLANVSRTIHVSWDNPVIEMNPFQVILEATWNPDLGPAVKQQETEN